MSKSISLWGADYPDTPAVDLPITGGGTARFVDMDGIPEMVVLSYGNSTWDDFISAYTTNTVVYCRASSNSNPGSGAQNRMAFMAYVNNAANPTEVEFQYYRSVSSHTDSQQGDQVYVYKLNKTNGWSVTTREAYTKLILGAGLTNTFTTGISAKNTIKAKLNSETSLGTIGTTEGLYAVGVDSNGKLCVKITT